MFRRIRKLTAVALALMMLLSSLAVADVTSGVFQIPASQIQPTQEEPEESTPPRLEDDPEEAPAPEADEILPPDAANDMANLVNSEPDVVPIDASSDFTIERLTAAPVDITVSGDVNYDATPEILEGGSVTLLYAITVTGTPGTKYTVTDDGTIYVGGDPITGTIPDEGSNAIIYVTKTFTKNDVANGALSYTATVTLGTDGKDSSTVTVQTTVTVAKEKSPITVTKELDNNGKTEFFPGEEIKWKITISNSSDVAHYVSVMDILTLSVNIGIHVEPTLTLYHTDTQVSPSSLQIPDHADVILTATWKVPEDPSGELSSYTVKNTASVRDLGTNSSDSSDDVNEHITAESGIVSVYPHPNPSSGANNPISVQKSYAGGFDDLVAPGETIRWMISVNVKKFGLESRFITVEEINNDFFTTLYYDYTMLDKENQRVEPGTHIEVKGSYISFYAVTVVPEGTPKETQINNTVRVTDYGNDPENTFGTPYTAFAEGPKVGYHNIVYYHPYVYDYVGENGNDSIYEEQINENTPVKWQGDTELTELAVPEGQHLKCWEAYIPLEGTQDYTRVTYGIGDILPPAVGYIDLYPVWGTELKPLDVTKTLTSGTTVYPGDTVKWEITINNPNAEAITATVTDTLAGGRNVTLTGVDEDNHVTVPANSTATLTASYVVQASDVNATLSNSVTVEADGLEPVTAKSEQSPTVQGLALNVTKTASTTTVSDIGQVVTYTITVTNPNKVDLTGVTVTDPLTTPASWTIDSLAAGASASVTGTYTVGEYDFVRGYFTNTARATGSYDGISLEGSASATVYANADSSLSVSKTVTSRPANGMTYALGETIAYSISVYNDGNLTVNGITVTDPLTGLYRSVGSLAPGASTTAITSYTVTEADVRAGRITNAATAAGTDSKGFPVQGTGRATAPTEPVNAHLTSVMALTNAGSAANGAFRAGETANLAITVTNDGNQTQYNVRITERASASIRLGTGYSLNGSAAMIARVASTDGSAAMIARVESATIQPGTGYSMDGDAAVIASIAPGQSVTVNASYTLTQADIDDPAPLSVIATVGGEGDGPDPVPIPKEGQSGHLTITKAATSTPANGQGYALGETVTYSITATNDGNLTITNVVVTDDLTGGEWSDPSLAPGASQSFTTAYVVTEADILAGSVVNVAIATGTSSDPDQPDVPTVPGEEEVPTEAMAGHLTITKVATSTPANGQGYALGETITYSITATNDGNLTITNVVVADDLTGGEWSVPSLAPGASQSFTAAYVVTEADILAGSVVNVATATGTSPDPDQPNVPTVPGTEEVPTEAKAGHLTITKVATSTPANGQGYARGETVTYAITATNDGNLTITNVAVTDELEGATIAGGAGYTVDGNGSAVIAELLPGASATVAASYVVTEADILAGTVHNVATATGTSPDPDQPNVPVEPGTDDEPTEAPNGHITMTKVTTSEPTNGRGTYIVGDTITYEITVTNDGNLTLTNVTVTDQLPGAVITEGAGYTTDANGNAVIAELLPGASATVYASYTVTEADVDAATVTTGLVNTATATAASPDPQMPVVTSDVPATANVTTEARYTLNINYWYGAVGGAVAAPTFALTLYADEAYNVASPGILGFAASQQLFAGTMGAENLAFDVIYTAIPYTLTINYIYEDGTVAAAQYNDTLTIGQAYSVTSPAIDGYAASNPVVAGAMGAGNAIFTVMYVPNEVPIVIDEYGIPLNIGNVMMNVGDCFE